jgi:hypothetical protein
VPRPSSPLGAKASTERPYLTRHPTPAARTQDQTAPRAQNNQSQTTSTHSFTHNQLSYLPIPDTHFIEQPASLEARRPGTAGWFWKHAPPALAGETPPRAYRPIHRIGPDIAAGGGFLFRASARKHGGERIRTDDPLLAKQVLYQLSYAPVAETSQGRTAQDPARSAMRRAGLWPNARLPSGGFLRGAAAEKWAREDLNLRPHAYQACALTN